MCCSLDENWPITNFFRLTSQRSPYQCYLSDSLQIEGSDEHNSLLIYIQFHFRRVFTELRLQALLRPAAIPSLTACQEGLEVISFHHLSKYDVRDEYTYTAGEQWKHMYLATFGFLVMISGSHTAIIVPYGRWKRSMRDISCKKRRSFHPIVLRIDRWWTHISSDVFLFTQDHVIYIELLIKGFHELSESRLVCFQSREPERKQVGEILNH